MPRVDSVGGASAGVPIKNDCVWNDCFPRVSREDFKRVCVPFFKNLAKEFGADTPLKVMNDGEVTAVAGVQMMEGREKGCTIGKGTFGISMGSNCGAGYMLPTGEDGVPRHPGWLNELWTAPAVRSQAPRADPLASSDHRSVGTRRTSLRTRGNASSRPRIWSGCRPCALGSKWCASSSMSLACARRSRRTCCHSTRCPTATHPRPLGATRPTANSAIRGSCWRCRRS